MDIDAALSAIGSSGKGLPPPLPPLPANKDATSAAAAAPAPSSVPALSSTFKDALVNVLDVLLRVASIQANSGPASEQFTAASVHVQADPVSVQRALQQINSVPPQQWAAAAAALTPEQREDMHRRFLLFAQHILEDVREVGQGVSALRSVMLRVLPALHSLPEDAKFGTSAVLSDNYRVFNTVADVMRPEASNAVAAAKEKVSSLAAQVDTLSARMKKAGLNVNKPNNDTLYKTLTWVFIVLFILAIVAVGVLAYYYRRALRTHIVEKTIEQSGGRAMQQTFGGNLRPQTYVRFPTVPQWGAQ